MLKNNRKISILFIRHAESVNNIKWFFEKKTIDAALTNEGCIQAKKVGDDIRKIIKKNGIIYTSEMRRTIHTGVLMAANAKIEIIPLPYMSEIGKNRIVHKPTESNTKSMLSNKNENKTTINTISWRCHYDLSKSIAGDFEKCKKKFLNCVLPKIILKHNQNNNQKNTPIIIVVHGRFIRNLLNIYWRINNTGKIKCVYDQNTQKFSEIIVD